MDTLHILQTPITSKDFTSLPARLYPKGSGRFFLGHDPDTAHVADSYVAYVDGKPVGRYAFYEPAHLYHADAPAACLGSYECTEDVNVSAALLHHAKALAKEQGYQWLLGPMEGSTWNSYRFTTHNHDATFLLEPYHHSYYPNQWELAGFIPVATYSSNQVLDLTPDSELIGRWEAFCALHGGKMRGLNKNNLDDDLHKVAQFSNLAFAKNRYFSPIDPAEFVAKYMKYRALFDQELVRVLTDSRGKIHGVFFSFLDPTDPTGKTIVVKSIARLADSPFQQMGHYFCEKIKQIAQAKGCTRVIHAFMINNNASSRISELLMGQPFKSYTLYGSHL